MIGALIKKTEPHQKCSSRNPPMIGPRAAPPAKDAAHTAMALRRSRSSGNTVRISDRVEGISVAPPSPSSARAAISISGDVAKAARTEAAPKAAVPIISSRRRPIRSPTLPINTSRPASRNE